MADKVMFILSKYISHFSFVISEFFILFRMLSELDACEVVNKSNIYVVCLSKVFSFNVFDRLVKLYERILLHQVVLWFY